MRGLELKELLNEKVVWLLGSGFSKPLRGPLFNELFDDRTHNWVSAWLSANNGPVLGRVVELYRNGLAAKYWSDAEEFLGVVERYADPTIQEVLRRARMGTGNDWPFPQVLTDSTHLVAAATSWFVDNAGPDEEGHWDEAWQAYVDWGKLLRNNDHVVTFNYDRVVETACAPSLPGFSKLHGSVPPKSALIAAFAQNRALTDIQIPGRGKLRASTGALKPVWDIAAERLLEANRLVVIGYSFPASDSYARSFVFRHAKNIRTITLVLGTYPDATRVADMFRGELPTANVVNTGRRAEEYLATGSRNPLPGGSYLRFRHENPAVDSDAAIFVPSKRGR